jgi:DNA-binding response OmpR family regulator
MKNKNKILIIEDEPILVGMYRDKFESAGFKVLTSDEVNNGLVIAEKERPELVILDILLPKENGTSFLEKWKENSKISSIPVVVLSNFDDPQTKEVARNLGARKYLIKTDYEPRDLLKEVNKILKG